MTAATHSDTDLAARIQRLEDERDVLNTLYRYGHAIDSGDEAAWVDCFTEDGTFTAEARRKGQPMFAVTGTEELRHFIAGHTRRPYMFHAHCIVEPLVELDGDRAHVESYLFVLLEHEKAPVLRVFGRYSDDLERGADGKWRFKLRSAAIDGMLRGLPAFVDGMPSDQRSDAPPA
jgi:hypothetical protein